MTTQKGLPLSGYSIEKIYVQHQVLEDKRAGPEREHGQVGLGWDWRFLPTNPEPRFEVRLRVSVEPSAERDDYVSVSLVGRFKIEVPSPTVPLKDFVRFQAVAIMMPYARQHISALTSASYYGTYYLPSINVAEAMKDFDFAQTTGASQLQDLSNTVHSPSETMLPPESIVGITNKGKKRSARLKGDVR
jgi:preprotein translocase subunit SecB